MSRPMESEKELQNRLLTILKGVSQGLLDSEIAAQLGVNRWTIRKDIRLMQHHRDPRLEQAESTREVLRSEKMARLMDQRVHVKQDERFVGMTGITLEEKNFRNMIEFHRSQLMRIMRAEDQGTAIMVLSKGDRITMLHNGIISGQRGSTKTWKITKRAKEYLATA